MKTDDEAKFCPQCHERIAHDQTPYFGGGVFVEPTKPVLCGAVSPYPEDRGAVCARTLGHKYEHWSEDGHNWGPREPAKPTPDGLSEHEREVQALANAFVNAMDFGAMTAGERVRRGAEAAYNRAFEIFSERVKRAEEQRDAARAEVERLKDSATKWAAVAGEQQAEVRRLKARVVELVEALDRAAALAVSATLRKAKEQL